MKTNKQKITTIDEYLQKLPPQQSVALQFVRKNIHEIIPNIIEVISYQIPTFKHPESGGIIAFGAFKNHLSIFLMSKKIVPQAKEILKDFEIIGTTVHFNTNKVINKTLLKKIIQIRLKENEGRINKKKLKSILLK